MSAAAEWAKILGWAALICYLAYGAVQIYRAGRKARAKVAAAYEAKGYARAVANLRDNNRLREWILNRLAAAIDRPWPENEYPPSAEYADYLEAVATQTPGETHAR